ncbi:MAG: hypothetical protein ACYCY9_10625 [Thiobacillus sp.]
MREQFNALVSILEEACSSIVKRSVFMESRLLVVLLAAALAPALIGCETGPSYGDDARDPHYSVSVVFTDHDRRLINDYYAPRYRNLPPGLAKRDRLPPGHAWRVRRNQPIPDDARWRYLPGELEQRLTRLPPGYVRVVVGTDVAIMNVRSRVVVDVLEDIAD